MRLWDDRFPLQHQFDAVFAHRRETACQAVRRGNMFSDQCLQELAVLLDIFWQRRDLIHYHDHWGLPKAGEPMGDRRNMPDIPIYVRDLGMMLIGSGVS